MISAAAEPLHPTIAKRVGAMVFIATLLMASVYSSVLDQALAVALREAAVPITRTMREFAEQDLHIPDGPYKGERFRVATQPFTGLLLDELDSGRWPEVFVTGPSQTGKSLIGHIIPAIYAACELRRNIVVGMPDMRMVNNKWSVDFEPVFRASPKLAALLPNTGPGSRGGQIKDTITLTTGVVWKFMTTGGDDTQRAGFTAEGGVYVTEAARFSHSGEASVEADPLDQLRARMQALERRRRRLVVEGTLTVETELPWTARSHSTQSRIVTPCPHCEAWVAPEREHLRGWSAATTELQAADLAHWVCPACEKIITDAARRDANQQAKLLHVGQTIDRTGRITGELPQTERLWFRWSMFNNLLLSGGDIAIDEWKTAKLEPESEARENAEKKLAQFVWAVPWTPKDISIEALKPGAVSSRASDLPRGELPDDTSQLALHCDVGMYELHWVAIAGRSSGCAHVADYGTIPVLRRHAGDTAQEREAAVKTKLVEALNTLLKRCAIGWVQGGAKRTPDRVLIDAGWETDTIYSWVRRVGTVFFPAIGRGTGQRSGHSYTHPKVRTNEVRAIGDGYHLRRHNTHRILYFVMHSDQWKAEVHRAIKVASDLPGSLSLFLDQQTNHRTYEKHLLAERLVQKDGGRHGTLEVFESDEGKPNHYFDATYGALVGLHHAGWRILPAPVGAAPAPKQTK